MAEYEAPEQKRDFRVGGNGGGVKDLLKGFKKWGDEQEAISKRNPFNRDYDPSLVHIKKGEAGYGEPVGLTKQRGEKAKNHVYKEIICLLGHVKSLCSDSPDGLYCTFKQIFDRYVKISDKVVGILLRARKYGFLDFEGEMLWQRQDDDVRIYLLTDIDSARNKLGLKDY
ncbi:Oidioi.mRNA.OKI2018_I69.PAR.g9123.t1.cds [Oikopleura dioica]|uniref:Oidioi.mRNA.OKI2018_I69.PAR.g9123.t1.cds n=1 Tax=Oikopleura dioica TaxID=34765 RepID=A0ABN7RLQ2_OIKDI|nr:Oidioi.mRNA.OKI2018_I69.PAR.g9123.t1.cds [Oikopleura dioica]